jgi:hypothetical protein
LKTIRYNVGNSKQNRFSLIARIERQEEHHVQKTTIPVLEWVDGKVIKRIREATFPSEQF